MKMYIIVLFCFINAIAVNASAQAIEATTGKVTYFRIHDVRTRYGPPSDQIDVEVIIKISSKPDNAFGFTLRKDDNQMAHQAMVTLLKDAFDNSKNVRIEYMMVNGKSNFVLFRVIMEK